MKWMEDETPAIFKEIPRLERQAISSGYQKRAEFGREDILKEPFPMDSS
jgi:hypothetical protein